MILSNGLHLTNRFTNRFTVVTLDLEVMMCRGGY